MRPLPIWNQGVHSPKSACSFLCALVKKCQDHQWCWGRQFDLESHGGDPQRWYPIGGRGIHTIEAFLCFIGSVESLNDVCWHICGYSSAVADFLKMSFIIRCICYIIFYIRNYSITIVCISCTSAQVTWNDHHLISGGWLSIKPCLSWDVPPSFPNWSLSPIISLASHDRWNFAISTWRDSLLSLGWANKTGENDEEDGISWFDVIRLQCKKM